MAFGFKRLAGRNRRHVNLSAVDSPFEIGQEISDRQYRKYLDTIGKRGHIPGVAAIRDTERQLEALRASLERRAAELGQEAEALALREQAVSLREQEVELEKQLTRRARTDAGQRRYNAVLEAYVREKRRNGQKITKTEARKSEQFKQIMGDIKGKPNKRGNPNIRDQNSATRKAAFNLIGGGLTFKEVYENMFGPTNQGQFRGVDRSGRSIRVKRRIA